MKFIYAVLDLTAAMIVGPLMTHKLDAPAIRDFYGALSTENTQWNRYPDHFQLLCLGQIDEETGDITPQRRVVATGAGWMESQGPALVKQA